MADEDAHAYRCYEYKLNHLVFQAESGVRDASVTGVQTCALPISRDPLAARGSRGSCRQRAGLPVAPPGRSEERRVGKECRSRWSPYPSTKKRVKGEERWTRRAVIACARRGGRAARHRR